MVSFDTNEPAFDDGRDESAAGLLLRSGAVYGNRSGRRTGPSSALHVAGLTLTTLAAIQAADSLAGLPGVVGRRGQASTTAEHRGGQE